MSLAIVGFAALCWWLVTSLLCVFSDQVEAAGSIRRSAPSAVHLLSRVLPAQGGGEDHWDARWIHGQAQVAFTRSCSHYTVRLPLHGQAALTRSGCPYTVRLPLHGQAALARSGCPCTVRLPLHGTKFLIKTLFAFITTLVICQLYLFSA